MENDETKVENGKKVIKIRGWRILLGILGIIVIVFLCTRMIDSNNNKNDIENEKNPLIGKWMVQIKDTLQDGNYFEFSDNTFAYATSSSGIMKGTYTYSHGIKTATGQIIYSNEECDYYYVELTPKEVRLNDGRVIQDNLNKMEYTIGINGDKMISQNLKSKNVTNLKLIK